MHAFQQVLCAPCMCRRVRWTGLVNISVHICLHARYRMCICAHVCAVYSISAGKRGWGGIQLIYESTCCLAWGVIFDRRKDRGVVCLFSIFNAGWSVCGCMCVYTHTHTHTAQMRYSVVSPGVEMRHLEGPKNPHGLNLGIVHMCIHILGAGMRS